jgi:predicted RNase H-like HicB family nuclease
MGSPRYVYWQDGTLWLGYLEEFPDYRTQGESPDDLKEHLRDVFQELTSGNIPGVRRVAELDVPRHVES